MQARIRKAMEEKDQGFTLIELLVVIIIIGILSAIAIPVFLNQRKKGVDASLKADLKSMATIQETYITDNPALQGYAVSATAPNGVAVGAERFNPSPGNTVVVTLNTAAQSGSSVAEGYCINARNAGSTTPAVGFYYNSTKGGLMPNGTAAC